jgi:hypothetical protein
LRDGENNEADTLYTLIPLLLYMRGNPGGSVQGDAPVAFIYARQPPKGRGGSVQEGTLGGRPSWWWDGS